MGIGDQVAFEERLVRKLVVIAEAERSGSAVIAASEDRPSVSDYVFSNGSALHFYGEVHKQGTFLEGLLVEPGEHHTLLPCTAPASAAFLPSRGSWWSNDSTLAWTLQQMEGTLGLQRHDWKWYRKRNGQTYYSAEWSVQLRPLTSGTHLVMRGLQGSPFDDVNLVGMSVLLRVAWAIQTALHNAPAGAASGEPYATSFANLASQLLGDESARPSPSAPSDAGDALRGIFSPLTGDEVTLGDLSPKRLKLARGALPPAAQNIPVLGVIGSSGVLAPTKIVTLTPTHAFVQFKNARAAMPWSEIEDARPEATESDAVFLRSKRLGWVPIPGCGRAHAVADAFRTLAVTMGHSSASP